MARSVVYVHLQPVLCIAEEQDPCGEKTIGAAATRRLGDKAIVKAVADRYRDVGAIGLEQQRQRAIAGGKVRQWRVEQTHAEPARRTQRAHLAACTFGKEATVFGQGHDPSGRGKLGRSRRRRWAVSATVVPPPASTSVAPVGPRCAAAHCLYPPPPDGHPSRRHPWG